MKKNHLIQLVNKLKNVPIPLEKSFDEYTVSEDMFSPGRLIYTIGYNGKLYSISDENICTINEKDETMLFNTAEDLLSEAIELISRVIEGESGENFKNDCFEFLRKIK